MLPSDIELTVLLLETGVKERLGLRAKLRTFATMLSLARIALVVVFVNSAFAQQPAGETSKPASPPRGVITGRVSSLGGDPIAGATVYLSTVGVSSPPRSALADGGGDFKLEGLDAGTYLVWAEAPGFVSEAPVWPNDQRRYCHAGDSVNLTLTKGGVITGTVTTSTNTPLIAANVRAFRIRDENKQPLPGTIQFRDRITDDRGAYRIYGLQPGTYVVSAGGPDRFFGRLTVGAYDNDAPTFAPSSTRDTASEFVVRSGEETSVDIQYRSEAGHTISGSVTGLSGAQSLPIANVTLTDTRIRAALNGTPSFTYNNYTFSFSGVADGEYELYAQQYVNGGDGTVSEPRPVKVQGADLTGITLTLTPMASIAGRVVLESNPPADCVKRRATALQETLINARRWQQEAKPPASKTVKTEPATGVPLAYVNQNVDSVPSAKGDFTMRNLLRGSYRIEVQPPSAGWYVRSIGIGPTVQIIKPSDPNIARDGIMIKSGERVAGLTVTITEGAASLHGHVSVAEGQRLPPGLCVYVLPAERDSAENVLRFFEGRAESDGTFAIGNIAPGKYLIVARPAEEIEPGSAKTIRQDTAFRSKVLREAEALKKEVSFKPCERATDYELPYAAPATPRQ